jgi:predicted dehydrogenase
MGAYTRPELAARFPRCWAPLNHAEALKAVGVTLAALCDVNRDAVEAAGERHHVERLYADCRAMIDEIRPDILCIATRTAGRVDLIESALSRGVRAVHVEKPLALSRADAQRAGALVRDAKASFTYGTIRRYMPIYRQALALAMSGDLGALRQVAVNMGPTYLLWSHPHTVDLMLFLSGGARVTSVSARLEVTADRRADATGIDDDPIVKGATVEFEGGVSGVITAIGGMDTVIACERGNIVVAADGSFLRIEKPTATSGAYYPDVTILPDETVGPAGTALAIAQLAEELQSGVVDHASLDAAVEGIAIVMAMGWSHLNGGAPVSPADVPADFTVTGRVGALSA